MSVKSTPLAGGDCPTRRAALGRPRARSSTASVAQGRVWSQFGISIEELRVVFLYRRMHSWDRIALMKALVVELGDRIAPDGASGGVGSEFGISLTELRLISARRRMDFLEQTALGASLREILGERGEPDAPGGPNRDFDDAG